MKILFMVSSISTKGGAERVISIMANYWVEKDWEVVIATIDDGRVPPAYKLHSKVKLNHLGLLPDISDNIGAGLSSPLVLNKLIGYFSKSKPDAIISFMKVTNIVVLLATLKMSIPVIISERNNPVKAPINPLNKRLRKWLYPKASAVVCQTQGMLDYFVHVNGVVIPNPVQKPIIDNISPEIELPESKLLFAVGNMSKRKVKQKGFDLLIHVFEKLARKFDDWTLIVLGDGPERISLKNMVDNYNLTDRVCLPGSVNDIHSILQLGDLFVLSSRYEGFPNALCEAMACGLPAVSFDCPTGPSDIMRNGIDGLLVPPEDVKSLEASLGRLMANKQTRDEMGLHAQEIVNRFSVQKVMGLWENLLSNFR